MTVILESDGFADLLQRTEFMQRVSRQDARIIDRVREAKAEAIADREAARPLRGAPAQGHHARLRSAGSEVARDQEPARRPPRAVPSRSAPTSARRCVSTRADRKELEGHLVALEKEEAKVQARLAGFIGLGPIRQGSGAMIWPINGTFTSPFG